MNILPHPSTGLRKSRSGPKNASDSLFSVIPPDDTPFDYDAWNDIATDTDKYIQLTGDLFKAAHAYTSLWRLVRAPTTLTPAGLSLFEWIVDPALMEHSLHVATHGVLPCGDRVPTRSPQIAYSNVNDNPRATASELLDDVRKGRLILFTERSGPYTGNLMESKLAYVTQRDVKDPDKMKIRYIRDPRNEAIERIDNDRRPKRTAPRHQNVARRALYWKRRYPALPILICKRDVDGAFKLIPVSTKCLAYMGCMFSVFIAIYLALFFGWRPSPANWGIVSTLMMQYVSAYRPRNEYSDGPESLIDYQYVDDGAFVEPWVGLRPLRAVSLWECALAACLGSKALHARKREIEGNTATKIPLWGIIVRTDAETFSLPPCKIYRAREFLATIDYDPGVTRIPLKKLQELRGKLGRWSGCNASLACETLHIDRLIRFKDGLPSPKESLRQVKQAYVDFRDSLEYIRVQMETGDYKAQSYTGASSRVLSLGDLLSLPQPHDKLVWVGSDATLTQCAAADHSAELACVYSYSLALSYLSHLNGMPESYFQLIALSEFLGFLCVLIVRSEISWKIDCVCGRQPKCDPMDQIPPTQEPNIPISPSHTESPRS